MGVLGDEPEVRHPIAEQRCRQQRLPALLLLRPHRCEEQHEDEDACADEYDREPQVVVGGENAHHHEDESNR